MTTPDRDRSLEQWLRQTPIPVGEGEHCLDAETLAAWAEGAIDGPARAMAEAHAANCGRCQAMLAVMARTAPVPSPATGTFLQKWMMMLGPAVAAAAAVALWFAVGDRSSQTVLTPSTNEVAAPASTAAVPAATQPAPESSDVSSRGAVVPSDEKRLADARLQERRSTEDKDAKLDLSGLALSPGREGERPPGAAPAPASPAPAEVSPSSSAGARAAETTIAGNRGGQVNAPYPGPPPQQQINQANQSVNQGQFRQVPATPPPDSQAQNAARLEKAKEADMKAAAAVARPAAAEEPQTITAEKPIGSVAPAPPPAMPAKTAAAAAGADGRLRADALERPATPSPEAIAPDKAARWQVVAGRVVQKSIDGGRNWTAAYEAAEGVQLTAGGSASREVCWFVGRAGAVVVTTDGRSWRTLRFPEATDLVAVDVTDARSARVTTADGRVFSTTDGGTSWTRR